MRLFVCLPFSYRSFASLSWADTAASTIGRLWGSYTSPLPRYTPVLRLPLAPRKSLAGFLAATITGACIAFGFWGWLAPARSNPADVSWRWDTGVVWSSSHIPQPRTQGLGLSGLLGLTVISLVAGLVSGVAEALGTRIHLSISHSYLFNATFIDLGSLDDNLTLPIIAGGCLFGFLRLLGLFSG